MKNVCMIVIVTILITISTCLNSDGTQLSTASESIKKISVSSSNYDTELITSNKKKTFKKIQDNYVAIEETQNIESMKLFEDPVSDTTDLQEEIQENIKEEIQEEIQEDIIDFIEENTIEDELNNTQPEELPIIYGTAGRLYVNGFDVAVYDDGCSGSQATVDAYDSATWYRSLGTTVIADHWNQGFDAIKGVNIGDICYIEYEDGSRLNLICIGKEHGTNLKKNLLDANGNTVYGNYNYVMYTCNEDWQHVTLVYWELLDN